MKKLVTILVVLLLATSLFAQGGSESKSSGVLNFKLAENQPANNPISKGMLMFAELVKEKTNGTVLIDVYLDAQLGNENETIDQVQIGALDFARINTSALASTADEVGVFTLPYIFTSTDHKYKVLDGAIGQGVSDSLKKYNMIGLEYWEAGSRNFYSTK
ncbi:MAG: TRAP transporter substrate-binding protein DctP, partial [Sphaerochaeta sp.]